MRLDRAWIEGRIPHHGRMCLLDEVMSWDGERISCRSGSHRALDNPLRANGRLGIACGIEYAVQAMAVHGALTAEAQSGVPFQAARWPAAGSLAAGSAAPGSAAGASPAAASPAAGFLAGVRGVHCHVLRLDDVPGDLTCDALRVAGDRGTALYEFKLRSAARPLITGRATVILEPQRRQR